MSKPKKWEAEPGYESLVEVLRMAHDQAAYGKGKLRHANEGEAFSDQHIMQIAHHHGPGHATGQAEKKARESNRLPPKAAVEELLGAIVYSAAAVIAINAIEKLSYIKESVSGSD